MTRYYIIVYDVEVERVVQVYKILKQYLFWVQNSVFEGYLERSKFKEMMRKLNKVINPDKDSLIIYILRSNKFIDKEIIGKQKKKYEFVM